MIDKQGCVKIELLSELFANQFDLTNYVEPDGSTWIRIFHHNNPASAIFANTDDFTKPVYKDANRWFNCQILNQINNGKWELMVKQKLTSSDSETKYRWIQTVNPYTGNFNQTVAANITKITTSGYSTFANAGGMYKLNSSTFFCINNSSNGNWFGAIGSWSTYQGGIPGYPNTAVTSGYMDLYLRLDNTNIINSLSIGKNYIRAKEIIEG